jgi:hypothetical protein
MMTHNNAVCMTSKVIPKFLSCTKARRTDVHSILRLTSGVGTFYANGVCEVACAGITLELDAWLIDG